MATLPCAKEEVLSFFFYISQRIIVFGTSWEEDGLWGCDRRKYHINADIDRALDQYWKNHAGNSQ